MGTVHHLTTATEAANRTLKANRFAGQISGYGAGSDQIPAALQALHAAKGSAEVGAALDQLRATSTIGAGIADLLVADGPTLAAAAWELVITHLLAPRVPAQGDTPAIPERLPSPATVAEIVAQLPADDPADDPFAGLHTQY